MNISADPAGTARELATHPWFERVARLGYASNGILHLVLGILAAALAGGGRTDADQSGAMRTLSAQPFGEVLLWICAAGALLLGLWSLGQVFLAGKKWTDRVKFAGMGAAFLAVGFTFGRFAAGNPNDSGQATSSLSGELMKSPAGSAALIAGGLALIVMGGYYVYKGISRKFVEDLATPANGALSLAVRVTGMVGYPAKGLVLAALGLLFIVATVQHDPQEASGVDGALKAIRDQDFGPAALAVIGAGLIAYALYLFFRARYDRMR